MLHFISLSYFSARFLGDCYIHYGPKHFHSKQIKLPKPVFDVYGKTKLIDALMGVVLVVSGFVNYLILRKTFLGKRAADRKYWTAMLHFKLLCTVLIMTPLGKLIVKDELLLL